jgi:hypothetical protein
MIDKMSFIIQLPNHCKFNTLYPTLAEQIFQLLLNLICIVIGLTMLRKIQFIFLLLNDGSLLPPYAGTIAPLF